MLQFFTIVHLKLVTRWPSYSDGQTQSHTFFGVFEQGSAIPAVCTDCALISATPQIQIASRSKESVREGWFDEKKTTQFQAKADDSN